MYVTATDLKNNLGRYLELIQEEGSIVVTRNGAPIAKIIPFVQDRKSALDSLVGLIPDLDLDQDEIKEERLQNT